MKQLTYKLQYLVFRAFRGFLLTLSEKNRFKLGEKMGTLGYYLIKSRRLTTLANIKMAFPYKSKSEIKKIAVNSYKTMGKAFLGTIWLEKYMKNDDNFIIHGLDEVEKICEKTPVVFSTMHFGNMESLLKFSEDRSFVTVAKKQRNPYLNNYITKQRKHLNITLLQKSKRTSRELFEFAEKRENIALFSDHRDKGTKVKFFGRETVSPTGVATLALRYNRPLILVHCLFTKDNKTKVYFEKLEVVNKEENSFKENVHATTQKMIDRMEDIIMNYPEQWMWMHDRWKLYKLVKKGEFK